MQKKQRTISKSKMKAPISKARGRSSKLAVVKGPSDYNVRFATAAEYEQVRKAAAASRQSMNQFMIAAAMERAGQVNTPASASPAERAIG